MALAIRTLLLTGVLDPTFGESGKVTTDLGSTLEEVPGVVVQPDGRLVAAGAAAVDPNDILNADFALARYR